MADDPKKEEILPGNDNNEALDFGKKKKKKKVKEDLFKEPADVAKAAEEAIKPQTEYYTGKPLGGAAAAALEKSGEEVVGDVVVGEATGETEEIDFGKKKTKKKREVKFDEDQNTELEIPNKDEVKDDQLAVEKKVFTGDSGCDWQGSERDYTYDELLTRVFNIIKEKNPDMITGEKKKFVMKPPQVARVGTKKTSFSNFADICKLLRRQEKHLLNFLLAELGTSGSLDIQKQLTIKGRFQQKQIENVLRRYIKEYVTCHTCRSPDTNMVKEERLFFLKCENCGATCSVASIKSGFQAQVGRRAAQRARAT